MYVKNDSGQEECDEPEQLILFHSEMRDIVNDIISVIKFVFPYTLNIIATCIIFLNYIIYRCIELIL